MYFDLFRSDHRLRRIFHACFFQLRKTLFRAPRNAYFGVDGGVFLFALRVLRLAYVKGERSLIQNVVERIYLRGILFDTLLYLAKNGIFRRDPRCGKLAKIFGKRRRVDAAFVYFIAISASGRTADPRHCQHGGGRGVVRLVLGDDIQPYRDRARFAYGVFDRQKARQ